MEKLILRRLSLLVLLLVAAAVIFVFRGKLISRTASKPNVVLLIIDTLRADKLGIYGSTSGASPELDELARQGTYFEHVVAQCSWTRPSIATMLTSRAPATHGIRKERWDTLDDRFLTLAEALKSAGYATFGITANPNINSTFNFQQGFDRYVDSAQTFNWLRGREPNKPDRAKVRTDARTILQQALDMVRAKAAATPGYLQINIMDVHAWSKLRPDAVAEKFRGDPYAKYLQGVSNASRETMRFVSALRALPGWEDTLLVIISDHGEGLGDHPDVSDSERHGNLLYETHLLVPLIFNRPGDARLQARKIAQPIRMLEVMPTILDYVGLPLPAELEGKSALPLIHDTAAKIELPQYFLSQTNWRNVNKAALYSYTDGWQYIESRDGWEGVPPEELQVLGKPQNGIKTSRTETEPDTHAEFKHELGQLESKANRGTRNASQAQPNQDEIKQLESLGYLQ